MKKKILASLLLLLTASTGTYCTERTKNSWTLFVYMEASEEMQHEAIFNLTQMATAGVPENVTMLIELHTKGDRAWLLQVKNHNIQVRENLSIGPNAKNNILDTLEKIIPNYPSDYFGLILWDHGFGILEPFYNYETNEWEVAPDGDHVGSCEIFKNKNIKYKGLLTDAHHKTYMGNDDMVAMTKTISEDILGKKIDIFAMDLCLGAMLEHGYQLKKYANYLVGSQDCELADGFDYETLMKHFEDTDISPKTIAQHIVYDYGNYNAKHASIGQYTMSAIDLHYMKALAENINAIADSLLSLLDENKVLYKEILHNIRTACPRFCMASYYIDLFCLYELLEEKLTGNNQKIIDLKKLLKTGKKLIKKSVVANIAGKVNKDVQGISIYYPFVTIDQSYPKTLFAQESTWYKFLEKIITN